MNHIDAKKRWSEKKKPTKLSSKQARVEIKKAVEKLTQEDFLSITAQYLKKEEPC